MAEASAKQASFGWGTESSAVPSSPTPKARRADRAARRPPRPVPQPNLASISEPQLPPDNELWDVRAAARFLKRSVSWVYHRAEDGTLPVKRLGGWGLRFVPGELRAWVDHGGAAKRG